MSTAQATNLRLKLINEILMLLHSYFISFDFTSDAFECQSSVLQHMLLLIQSIAANNNSFCLVNIRERQEMAKEIHYIDEL